MSQGINIVQTSSIDQSNYTYYFSNKDYAISNPIRSSSQNFKVEPNRTMAGKALDSQSGTYNFIIRKSQYNLIDLKDCMFIVTGTLIDKSRSSSSKYRLGCGGNDILHIKFCTKYFAQKCIELNYFAQN